MALLLRQIRTLTSKTILIVLLRHPIATTLRALFFPIVLIIFLSFARNLFVPPALFGIGAPHPVRSLKDGLFAAASTGRETVVFVNSGLAGGDIDRVIDLLVPQVESAGKRAVRLTREADLNSVCRSSLRGVTECYGALVMEGSPTEGAGGIWNYTLRSDGALGSGRVDVTRDDNDGEIYTLPFQRAVDSAIATVDPRSASLPDRVLEYPFTSLTIEERANNIRVRFQAAVTNFFGVTFIMGIIGICYHMTGFMATEREIGMSTLLEAMMTTKRRWQAQAARLISYHLAFSLLYLPSWVIVSLILGRGVFAHTNVGIILLYHILAGLALASMSLLGGAFFKRAQLSGVTVTIVFLLLATFAQTVSYPKTTTVAVLSLLFTPCNYVYFITAVARFEQEELPINLGKTAPTSSWNLPGGVLWLFLILQIIVYPILGAYIEKWLYSTGSSGRNVAVDNQQADQPAVRLEGFTKIYGPGFVRRLFGFVRRPRDPVVAVDALTLTAGRGQILALLGANGSGKSTTLDAIAGTNKLTSGKISIDGTGGLGIAPQKNVLWDELNVEEHVRIFNKLKSPHKFATKAENLQLIASVDLASKVKAQSRTLSGGQKRKLQLGMMLTGGSAVCCVDEVSSGLDPLSRRKIWDILLAERGRRTIILTTHFLDEADLLADHIAVLSKGSLRADGSSVELKDKLGGGYRIHVHKTAEVDDGPDVEGVAKKNAFDVVSYIAPSSGHAAVVIKTLEDAGIHDYRFSGPTIEDVFLQLAEEVRDEGGVGSDASQAPSPQADANEKHPPSPEAVGGDHPQKAGLELLSGERISVARQTWVLFLKRCTVFKHNWFPSLAAFAIPIIAAGLVMLFIRGQQAVGCSVAEQSSDEEDQNIFTRKISTAFVAGPVDRLSQGNLVGLFGPVFASVFASNGTSGVTTLSNNGSSLLPNVSPNLVGNLTLLVKNITLVNSFDEFNNAIVLLRKNITPAGFWLGDGSSPPAIAYRSNAIDQINGFFGQNFLNVILTNTSIAATYSPFDIPWSPDTGNSLQLLVYVALALSAYPGFFALYPNLERRRQVRGLEYSNGVRAFPLWLAYLLFDFMIVLASSVIATILFAALSSVWYHVGYLFLIFTLYGITAILLAYVISLFCKSQLSAYAFTAGSQSVLFLGYLIAYLCTITYAPVNRVDGYLLLVHFLVSVFAPIGSVVRTMFLALNLFSTTCVGEQLAPNPGGILQYGGPILLLAVQAVLLFSLVLWLDSGNVGGLFRRLFRRLSRRPAAAAPEADPAVSDEEVAHELARVVSSAAEKGGAASTDGLRVVHVTKAFGKNTAVDNVTFGIRRGEVFALLGPNGAGKSTTISMIRGDVHPNQGAVFVEGVSVFERLAAARAHLGVCPQFDAIDQMTVREHLRFYARVRGVPDVDHNVRAVLRAVGLGAFEHRQAHALSGGNKRKLSLGIALMGNPAVLLLDEPSSGLDAAAKRIMWKTLAATVPGRSILLTTHSMEEADALAGRAGILSGRMLALGSTEQLRARFGDHLHVHLVCRGAPRTADADMEALRRWVTACFPAAEVEDKTYHGQMRFAVPLADVARQVRRGTATQRAADGSSGGSSSESGEEITQVNGGGGGGGRTMTSQGAIGQLVVMLEEQKGALGIEHYSVSPTTLDQVFLTIVGRHNVQEEGYHKDGAAKKARPWWRWGS